jgi:twitching motility protein PilT
MKDYKEYVLDLIEDMHTQGASDLHLSTGRYPAIRISGELVFLERKTIPSQEDMLSILEVLTTKERVEKFLKDQELDFAFDTPKGLRLRGSFFYQKSGISVALRLIPEIDSLENLKLPSILEQFALARQGFFLVVGPVGQGKSTTLAAMVNIVNEKRAAHIVTIEDPVEHIYPVKRSIIDQRDVGIDTLSFESALKTVFRSDANVILIGEMRNHETMAAAVTAAETGHLVFATLHTNSASQTIDRIIDSFPPAQQDQIRTQLASSLLGIFSQRLVPKITGGRIPAYELLINNNAVANLIREKRTHEIDVVIETGLEHGMVDINRSLIELVRAGEITMESAMAYSTNPRAFQSMM